jgi:maleate isomerase
LKASVRFCAFSDIHTPSDFVSPRAGGRRTAVETVEPLLRFSHDLAAMALGFFDMRDVLGWRRKFGVIGPSTNTVVQPDFEMMRPAGVTNHYSRIFTPNAQAISNESFMAGINVIGDNVLDALRSIMTCSPDYLVMGMSSITFNGGAAGADAFQAKIEREAGVSISIGSHSSAAALKAYGSVKRIAFLSPYYPVANAEVRRYFAESGFEVVRDMCLRCKSWTGIAEVPPEILRDKLIELNGDGRDTDALIQVGTNLSMVRLAAAAEMWLGKPVVAINTATYWHALRQNNIKDKIAGFGRLLEEF